MTLTIAIQFPDHTEHWQMASTNQATTLHAAADLAQPDGTVISWWPTPQQEEWS